MNEVKKSCLKKLMEIENQLKDIKIKIDQESFEEALMLCSKLGLECQNMSTILLNRYLDKENSKYLIKINDSVYLDDIILTGNKEELYEKLKDKQFVKSLGIPESVYFERFELIRKDD